MHRWLPFVPLAASIVVPRQTVDLQSTFGPYVSNETEIFVPPLSTTELTQRWTVWEAPSYLGAIKPATEADLQAIVRIASKNSIPFLATGAGHGASIGFGAVENTLNIDLGNFNTVNIDATNNLMTIGGSVTASQFVDLLHAAGKEIPTGNAACVGYVGLTLGAGVGPLQGLHGLVLDGLKSVRLVTASGDLITVSETQNSDLFWGLRGAGANFGIVTSATYKIYNATNNGQLVNADFAYPAAANRSVWELLASFDNYIPPELVITLAAGYNRTAGSGLVQANVLYFGSQSRVQDVLNRFLAIGPTRSNITTVPWNRLLASTFFGTTAAACIEGSYTNEYAIGLGRTDVPTYEAFFRDLVSFNAQNPTYNGRASIARASAAKALSVPANKTVYPWRNIKTNILFLNTYANSSLDGQVDAFMRSQRAAFAATSGFPTTEAYIYFSHGDEGPDVWYGKQNLPRLTKLKQKWDPRNLFGRGFPVPLNGY